jgi:hypothetical protein
LLRFAPPTFRAQRWCRETASAIIARVRMARKGRAFTPPMLHCDGPHIVGWSVVVWGLVLWNILQLLVPVARAALFCGMLFCGECKCKRRRGPAPDGPFNRYANTTTTAPSMTTPFCAPVGKCLICFQDPAEDPVWCNRCSVRREEGRACCRRCLWAWTRTGSPTCPLCRGYAH